VSQVAERPPAGARGFDLLNFFVANAQTGFGPFIAVYLTANKWTQANIGLALSLGTVAAVVSQIPAGVLVDMMSSKRTAIFVGVLGIMAAALLLAAWPTELPVLLAQALHAVASCVLTPAIAAVSLQLVGHAALGERLGRNARYASIGNGIAAAVMGATGSYLSSRTVFWLTAALCVPALMALMTIAPGCHARALPVSQGFNRTGMRTLLLDRRLQVFATCVLLFHLSDAAMLPLAASAVTMRAGSGANLIIAACIVVPQAVVAMCSPGVGRMAMQWGRRPVLLLGWAALPLRGLLLAVLPGPYLLVAVQTVSGVSAAVFGVMLPLLAADLTRGRPHFNLCLGVLGLAASLGATLSTGMAGWVADALGVSSAFLCLTAAGAAGWWLLWVAMPETGAG